MQSAWLHSIAVRSVWCRAAPPRRVTVSTLNPESSRSASSASGRARSRTAASSMASGMPLSRRHSRTTSARLAAVTANPGAAEAARCANSSTASPSIGSGGDREGVLARRVERLPAGREHGHLGRGPQHRLGEGGAGVDQVLAGVEDQQHPAVPHVLEHGRLLQAGVPFRQPEDGRDLAGEQRRVGHPGQLDEHDAVGEPAGRQRGRGDVQAEPALPDPARADHGDEPGGTQQGRQALRLRHPADEAIGLDWQQARPSLAGELACNEGWAMTTSRG